VEDGVAATGESAALNFRPQGTGVTTNLQSFVTIQIYNPVGGYKYGTYQHNVIATSTPANTRTTTGHFFWKGYGRITQIDIGCVWGQVCSTTKGSEYNIVGY
jgi:hypothetical protein